MKCPIGFRTNENGQTEFINRWAVISERICKKWDLIIKYRKLKQPGIVKILIAQMRILDCAYYGETEEGR